MNIEETQSTVKITEATANFLKTIDKLPWLLLFWEAEIIFDSFFKTKIESNGEIDKDEIIKMAHNCAKELESGDDENVKIEFTLYFLKY